MTTFRALAAAFFVVIAISGALASAKAMDGLELGSENAGWLQGP